MKHIRAALSRLAVLPPEHAQHHSATHCMQQVSYVRPPVQLLDGTGLLCSAAHPAPLPTTPWPHRQCDTPLYTL
jgi:hypothetical protein